MENIKEKIAEIIDSVSESTLDLGDHEQCTLNADDVYWMANKLEEYQEKTEGLEKQWELLKFELEQKEGFYGCCEDCGNEIDVIHDIQSVMLQMDTGEYDK